MQYFLVAAGSAVGGLARFWISGAIANRVGQTFPWGTILVNISGSFLIGFLAALISTEGRLGPKHHQFINQFLMIGVCGGYTTFSSFSLQTLTLVQGGEWLQAGANVGVSVVACLIGVWLGHVAGQLVNR
ncbi:MAG: fluoride efflux transporter CrcB [Verrucomicrobiota bacterium]